MMNIEPILGIEFPHVVIPLLAQAKKSIRVIVFDWRWYPDSPGNPVQAFNHEIVKAVRRGCSVEVVTNSETVIATLRQQGIKAKKLAVKNLVHAKLMLIDDEICVLGSHNYTQSAFTMNFEASVLMRDAFACLEFLRFFNSLFLSGI